MENIYGVFALLDSNKCIIGIESEPHHTEEYYLEKGYIKIDEGSGNTYGHAQGNYLINKYENTMHDEQRRCNFMYDGEVRRLTDEEKVKFYPPIPPQPTTEEKFDSRLTYVEIMMGVV